MKYVVCIAIGLVVGHYGPITVTKYLASGTSKVLVTTGKAVDSANKLIK